MDSENIYQNGMIFYKCKTLAYYNITLLLLEIDLSMVVGLKLLPYINPFLVRMLPCPEVSETV